MKRTILFKGFILVGLTLFLLPSFCFSNEAKDMFPKVDGLELKVGDKVYTPDNLWDIINGAADAYLSYDFRRLYTATYSDDQDRSLKVYIFEHSSSTNTFGIYSQERSTDYEFVETGAQGFKSHEAYYFITGPYYVQISTNDKGISDSMDKIARSIDEDLGQKNQLPEELKLFPEKDKVPYSEKYIAGNFLGYGFLHSAFISDYKHSGEAFQVFVISPENKQETTDILNEYLDFVDYPEDKRNQDTYHIEDPYNGSILLHLKGGYLCGVMGASGKTKEKYLALLKNKMK